MDGLKNIRTHEILIIYIQEGEDEKGGLEEGRGVPLFQSLHTNFERSLCGAGSAQGL